MKYIILYIFPIIYLFEYIFIKVLFKRMIVTNLLVHLQSSLYHSQTNMSLRNVEGFEKKFALIMANDVKNSNQSFKFQ